MNDTYWTAFFFKGDFKKKLHVTHKYLGEQSVQNLQSIISILDDHFFLHPLLPFDAVFDQKDTFTNDGKPVTVWKPTNYEAPPTLNYLRDDLAPFRLDEHAYTPHVTNDEPVAGTLSEYRLMCGDTMVRRWSYRLMNTKAPTEYVALRPIIESKEYQDEMERRIRIAFKKVLYQPLMNLLGDTKEKLENASSELLKAISKGTITSYVGQQQITFRGKFSASISKELRALGAKYNSGYFTLPTEDATKRIKQAIKTATVRNEERAIALKKKLGEILPVEITKQIQTADLFDDALYKIDKDFVKNVKSITIEPQLTAAQRLEISKEWSENMDLWVKNFAEEEIIELRKQVQQAVFSGQRNESLAKTIQDSYGVTSRKAKFLARQETNLLMAEFKKQRYVDAGVPDYIWGCVVGSPKHPVRPSHKKLEGKIFSWNNPPITDDQGNRNNPGQDYNCRCFAKPIVRF